MGVIRWCLRRGRAAASCAALTLIVAGALAALAFATARTAGARADYGDAPDGARAGYLTAPGVVGHFPSLAKSGGSHHTDTTGALRLGQNLDAEGDSKQVNLDRGDDGFFARLRSCHTSTLTFVIDASRLPDAMRGHGHTAYLNALFDWNRDGRWKGASRCGGHKVGEWLVHNRPVDMATFADQPIQAIEVTVPAGPQVRELWIRATLTLDQQMKTAGQGAFTFGETEDYFYGGPGPTPKHKGKNKKKGKKGGPENLAVDCVDGFMDHGATQSFFLFFSDPDTGAWVIPTPGSVDVQVVNGQKTFPAVPGDVSVTPFSYGYKVTSKLKDDRANPFEDVALFVQVTSTKQGQQVDAGPFTLGLLTNKGVVLGCTVLILHSHHVVPGGGPPTGGGPPGGPGQPGGPGAPGSGQPSNQAPTAAFTLTPNNPPTGPKAGQPISFDGSSSSDPDGTVVAWSWSVGATLHGGGGTSNVTDDGTPHPTIRFPTAGIYPVTLTVTDNGGKTSSVTHNVFVSSAGLKSGAFTTDPMDVLGCSGTIMATEDIYIPTYAQTPVPPVTVRGAPTGGCAVPGATITITKITRQSSNAPPDDMGNPRLDEWGNVKDTVHIEFTISGGSSAQGTVPFTVSWQ